MRRPSGTAHTVNEERKVLNLDSPISVHVQGLSGMTGSHLVAEEIEDAARVTEIDKAIPTGVASLDTNTISRGTNVNAEIPGLIADLIRLSTSGDAEDASPEKLRPNLLTVAEQGVVTNNT